VLGFDFFSINNNKYLPSFNRHRRPRPAGEMLWVDDDDQHASQFEPFVRVRAAGIVG